MARSWRGVAGGLLLVWWGTLSAARAQAFRSNLTVWTAAVGPAWGSPQVAVNLAAAYLDIGDLETADQWLTRAEQQASSRVGRQQTHTGDLVRANRAIVLDRRGGRQAACQSLKDAVETESRGLWMRWSCR